MFVAFLNLLETDKHYETLIYSEESRGEEAEEENITIIRTGLDRDKCGAEDSSVTVKRQTKSHHYETGSYVGCFSQ